MTDERLSKVSDKAKTTVEVLVSNMTNPALMTKIYFRKPKDLSVENAIKMVFRAKKLHEVRERASVILRAIVEFEVYTAASGTVWRILQDDETQNELHPTHH